MCTSTISFFNHGTGWYFGSRNDFSQKREQLEICFATSRAATLTFLIPQTNMPAGLLRSALLGFFSSSSLAVRNMPIWSRTLVRPWALPDSVIVLLGFKLYQIRQSDKRLDRMLAPVDQIETHLNSDFDNPDYGKINDRYSRRDGYRHSGGTHDADGSTISAANQADMDNFTDEAI
jgi:hypothetical protein